MRNKKILLAITIIVVGIIALIISNKPETHLTSSMSLTESNKKIEWGVKRAQNNEQPDLGTSNKNLIDESERNSNGKL